MSNNIVVIIAGIVCAIMSIILIASWYKVHKYNSLIKRQEDEYQHIKNAVDTLRTEKDLLNQYIDTNRDIAQAIQNEIDDTERDLKNLKCQYDTTKNHLNDIQKIAQDNEAKLIDEYNKAAQEYDNKLKLFKQQCSNEEVAIQAKIDSLKTTYHTITELWRKQEQEKAGLDNYRLGISQQDKQDIVLLEHIRPQFSHPRVISKIIWQTYFQPLAKQRFIMILGNTIKCGVYKITNTLDNKCYIGQSVDIYKRWCEHCKCGCGCGIDTPKNNKLYAAMRKDGVENFTFELLEECPREELNQKEAFYINLYESNDYGYNSTQGNN